VAATQTDFCLGPSGYRADFGPKAVDVTWDGKRFLFITTATATEQAPFTVVLNWTEESVGHSTFRAGVQLTHAIGC
jgi:hypothetical protein